MRIEHRTALYTSDWMADPGGVVRVMTSGHGPATATLVRLRGLLGAGLPTGYVEEDIGESVQVVLEPRDVPMGSYATTPSGPMVAHGSTWEWQLRIFPTLAGRGEIVSWGDDGPQLSLTSDGMTCDWQRIQLALPLPVAAWSDVRVRHDGRDTLEMHVTPLAHDAWTRCAAHGTAQVSSAAIAGPLTFGRGFNGKIESPSLRVNDATAAAWDFAADMTTQQVRGTGPQARTLTLVNAPRRASTSSAWSGSVHDWRVGAEHYAAIHFHDDDLSDCLWPVDLELPVPDTCESGIYAVRLVASDATRYAPVFVRPRTPARVAFLVSTFSYLAYGNSIWSSPTGESLAHDFPVDDALAHRFGLSTYCRHCDGSGISLVSTQRPILNAAPGFLGETIGGQVLLNDDLRIVSWLDQCDVRYDVITDHDLHVKGASLLADYDVVVTGAHPEYHTAETLAAMHTFVGRGGRLMYLGGNGFYWRVSLLAGAPHVMELRRAESGIRIWAEQVGEYHHQSDGALGGLWRRIGTPPNRLIGVGFSAQGSDHESRPFERTAASHDPRVAFLFEGVSGDVFGTHGPTGASAGYELDRADTALGTPRHALIVARSQSFGESMSPVNEERLTHELIDAVDPLRADMTFFETPNGGAVFSVASILFAGTLDQADGAGKVALNVLRRFADPAPFVMPNLA